MIFSNKKYDCYCLPKLSSDMVMHVDPDVVREIVGCDGIHCIDRMTNEPNMK